MPTNKPTPTEIALDMAYREDVPIKSNCKQVGFWIDIKTAERIREYAERLGLKYSELYRGIFLANLPTDDDIEKHFKEFGVKQR